MRVLVTGAAGRLGRNVVHHLVEREHEVFGIDRRPWPSVPDGVHLVRGDVRKRPAEELFRGCRPQGVIHMATVTHFDARGDDRHRINLVGTRAVFDWSQQYGIKQVVFVGRHTYYGAAADEPLYHREDDPPFAVNSYPELADMVAADLYAGSTLWRYPHLATCVLRACYSLGPRRHGTLATYLKGPRVPMVLGFDPLFQFMHESDISRAIVLALERGLRGVYNVAGPPPLPLSVVIAGTGRVAVRLPRPIFDAALGRFGMPDLPRDAIAHVQFPVTVDDGLFRAETGFCETHDATRTMTAFRDADRVPQR